MFKPNQKVVCVDPYSRGIGDTSLEQGGIYTIESMSKCSKCNADLVILKDSDQRICTCACGNKTFANAYFADRFTTCVLQISY